LPTALPPEDTTVRTTAAKAPMTRCAEGYSRRGREREREKDREKAAPPELRKATTKRCVPSPLSLSLTRSLSHLFLFDLSAPCLRAFKGESATSPRRDNVN
jgi:hypothetical protein